MLSAANRDRRGTDSRLDVIWMPPPPPAGSGVRGAGVPAANAVRIGSTVLRAHDAVISEAAAAAWRTVPLPQIQVRVGHRRATATARALALALWADVDAQVDMSEYAKVDGAMTCCSIVVP